jgi:serine/threonine protein kinase
VSIGDRAFSETSIKSIVVPEKVHSIGSGAFAGSRLTVARFRSAVSKIEAHTFAGCHFLEAVDLESPEIEIDTSAFEGTRAVIYLPTGTTTKLIGTQRVRIEISESPAPASASLASLMLNPETYTRDMGVPAKKGRVMKLVSNATHKVCAAKELTGDQMTNETLFHREIEVLKSLRHPGVVDLVGYYLADDDQKIPYTILTEWIAGG